MPILPYPKNVIWYVEARFPDDSAPSCGSAVAIRLRKIGDLQSLATYLITCEHVLRGCAQDGSCGFGAPLTKIRVWRPGTAYNEKLAREAKVVIKKLTPGEVPPEKRTDEANDWIIMELPDADRDNTDAITEWVNSYPTGKTYTIVGYPGGSEGFSKTEVVEPTSIPNQFQCQEETNGILQSVGSQTRPGTSGGGVFESGSNAFAGIHRSRIDSTLRICAVSATKIRERLRELGYKPTLDEVHDENAPKFDINILSSINNAIEKICSIIRHSEISESLSHNRTQFFEKIDQLFQRNLEKMANVIDINEFRKTKAVNIVSAISEELPKKFNDFKKNTDLFATCSSQDPLLDRSKNILQEIETIVSCIRKLFHKFSPRDKLYEKLDNLDEYRNLSNFISNLREVTESVNNKGGEQGLDYLKLQNNLNKLSYSIDRYSNLLKDAVEK